jgi:type I restriction enzyme S subunit
MELRPGYKLTEVGVIPEDWSLSTMTELAEIRSGGTPSTARPEFWDGGVPWCTPTDITALRGRRFLVNTSRTISHAGLIASSAELIPSGSLIMTSRATIGECAINVTPITTNQGFKNLTPNSDIDHAFFYYLIASQKHAIRLLAAGSTFLEIGKRELSGFVLAWPSNKSEQTAIATALSDADDLIEALENLLTKKRLIKQGAMQELLTGKRRLPEFSGEWVVKRLGEVADIRSGGTPSTARPDFWDGDVFWCTPTDITALQGKKYLQETARRISEKGLRASSAEMIPSQSIVMTSRATIGECAIIMIPVATNQGFKNFVPLQATDVEFLYYLLCSQTRGFIALCAGSTFLEIGKTQVARYEVQFPPLPEQSAIATVLSDMDTELDALTAKLAKARQIKQGMMQELITGRIRLV